MLSGEEDNMSAIMTINLVQEGLKEHWAEMLIRMYIMWGEKNGMKVKELIFNQVMRLVLSQ